MSEHMSDSEFHTAFWACQLANTDAREDLPEQVLTESQYKKWKATDHIAFPTKRWIGDYVWKPDGTYLGFLIGEKAGLWKIKIL